MDFIQRLLQFDNYIDLVDFLHIMNFEIVIERTFFERIKKVLGFNYKEFIIIKNNISTYIIKYKRLGNKIDIEEVGTL